MAPEVLSNGCQHELVLCATWTAKAETSEPQDALQMREPHLDAFTVVALLFKSGGPSQRPRDIASALVDAARDLTGRRIGTTLGFHWAWDAVSHAATVKQCDPVIHQVPLVVSVFRAGQT